MGMMMQDTRYTIQDAGSLPCRPAGKMQAKKYKAYKDLDIYQLAHKLAVEIHKMAIKELPRFELYEVGSQIRRSSKSVSTNMVEGFGLRRYKNEFIKYLTIAHASCDETREHLEFLFETESLQNKELFEYFINEYEILSRKMNNFISAIEFGHKTRRTK